MIRPRPPLVSVLVASALTLILAGRSGGPLATGEAAARSAARAAFVPVEVAGDAVFRPLEGVIGALGGAGDLAAVEAELSRQRQRAEAEAGRADGLAAENGRLAALLGVEGPAAAEGVAARVVSTGLDPSGAALLIDRGAAAGIRVGMPVVAAGGLVGRVIEVGARQTTVLPLTNPASAAGVRCVPAAGTAGPADREEAGARPTGEVVAGVVQGRGGPALRLDLLDPTATVRSGDLVVTSGMRHSLFPAGLAVGRVTGAPDRFAVEPFSPPSRLELVKVLRWEPEP